jgi:hypothetical protein
MRETARITDVAMSKLEIQPEFPAWASLQRVSAWFTISRLGRGHRGRGCGKYAFSSGLPRRVYLIFMTIAAVFKLSGGGAA